MAEHLSDRNGNIKVRWVYIAAGAVTLTASFILFLNAQLDRKIDKIDFETLRIENKTEHRQYDADIRFIRETLAELKIMMKEKSK